VAAATTKIIRSILVRLWTLWDEERSAIGYPRANRTDKYLEHHGDVVGVYHQNKQEIQMCTSKE